MNGSLITVVDVGFNVEMQKNIKQIKFWGVVGAILSVLFLSDISFGQKGFAPLLPLPRAEVGSMAADDMMRDAGLKQNISDDMSAEQLVQDILNLKDELKHSQGPRRLEVLDELYQSMVSYTYYLEDVINGKYESTLKGQGARQKLAAFRQELSRYATTLAKEHKDKRIKARAMYHVLAIQYQQGQSRSNALKNLEGISKNLNANLNQKIRYLTAMNEIQYGDRKKGQMALAKMLPSLSKAGKLNASLVLSRSLAGLKGDGKRVAAVDNRYKTLLNSAVQSGSALSDEAKEDVLAQAVTIWSAAEGRKIDWSKPPFSMKAFANNEGRYAVLERDALQKYSKGDHIGAIKTYQRVAKFYEGRTQAVAIDQRILDMQYQEFKKSKDVKPYENTLVYLEQKYREPNALGDGHEKQAQAAHGSFVKQYRNLVYAMLQTAHRKDAKSKFRLDAIAVATRYEGRIQDENERADVKASTAELYALENRHNEAVAIYMDLVLNAKNGKTAQYLRAAITSQSIVAHWPKEAPWDGFQKGNVDARTSLRDMYAKQNEMNGEKLDWSTVAHLGLLQINLNQGEEAFKLWEAALQKAPQHNHAAHAAGFMLTAYQKQKSWQKLETLARLCLQSKIQPLAGKTRLNPSALLADALFFGGKQALAEKRYGDAVKKLEEFTKSYTNDKRRDEGLFVLASSYRGNRQHNNSITTLSQLVQEYPSSKFMHDALLHGGSWSLPMALEEQTIFFYQRFLKLYRDDAKAPMIRSTMISLYMGRQLYGNAGRLMLEQGEVKNATREQKLRAAFAYMDLEERYGDRANARSGAKLALDIDGKNPATKAKVLAFEARQAQAENKGAKFFDLEKQLAKMDPAIPEVAEALGHVRFMIAEMNSQKTKEELFNIGLTDPVGTLNKHFAIFTKTAAQYKEICDHPEVAYCGPAMLRLSQITSNTIHTIEDLSLPETLDEKSVNDFNQRKQELVNILAKEAQEADGKAMALVADGNATPDWTQEILWTNSNDWNFDRITGETGNGYVQWNAKKSEKTVVDDDAPVNSEKESDAAAIETVSTEEND